MGRFIIGKLITHHKKEQKAKATRLEDDVSKLGCCECDPKLNFGLITYRVGGGRERGGRWLRAPQCLRKKIVVSQCSEKEQTPSQALKHQAEISLHLS